VCFRVGGWIWEDRKLTIVYNPKAKYGKQADVEVKGSNIKADQN
jgi:hypothetical protein